MPSSHQKSSISKAAQALTSAALLLPGLIPSVSKAVEDDSVSFQYSHYQEGKRNLFNVPNNLNPIEVDSIQGSTSISLAERINFGINYTQDTWSGATPITTAPLAANSNQAIRRSTPDGIVITGASPLLNTRVVLDRNLIPIQRDSSIGQLQDTNSQMVHVMTSASPETRKQGDFKLTYEWDEAALDLGGGISLENDYESRFGSMGGRFDFNQKLTTLKWGSSYTNSETNATLNHDSAPYITKTAFADQIQLRGRSEILNGTKEDWSGFLGVTQVLSKKSLLDVNINYTHSSGYMENPYKAVSVIFIDPAQWSNPLNQSVNGDIRALMEQRPDSRNQWNFSAKYVRYIEPLDAALHFKYQFSRDDWGINAHVFETDWVQPLGRGWTITPRIRYYSQDAAYFYQPYLTSMQSFSRRAFDAAGREIWVDANNPQNGVEYFRDEDDQLRDANGNVVDENSLSVLPKSVSFDPEKLPANFSSDHRLSGFGALSGGVTVAKQFAKGISLEAGFEYYTHQGSMKLGGGGEGNYADFDFFVANAALTVEFSALGRGLADADHAHHRHNGHQHEPPIPTGLLGNGSHMLSNAGDFMMGYVYMYSHQAGKTLNRTQTINDTSMVAQGYRTTPTFMDMHMHMVDIMYAPTDWFTLMLMPQFMDMNMDVRALNGINPPANVGADHLHGGHQTGGIGDTLMFGMFKLFQHNDHHFNMGLGFSAPTGDVGIKLNRQHKQDGGFIHYGMQLGSGTWDFLPSLTYMGQYQDLSWGAQVNGTVRMQSKNESGFAFGDIFQSSVWSSYKLFNWLSASVRGVYTLEGSVRGQFNPIAGDCSINYSNSASLCSNVNPKGGTMDRAQNYGGRYWDVGLGLNVMIPGGEFVGNHLSVEWLQPIQDDINGYQLERKGTLFASWNYMF